MNCLFCKIIAGDIPSSVVYENEDVYAFRDINPQAPVHVLVIPKKHVSSIAEVNEDNAAAVTAVIKSIPLIAEKEKLQNGFRVVSNVGEDGCQSVHHLHFHILGGTKLTENMA